MSEKRDELGEQVSKLRNGLFKIDDTRSKVEAMSVELEEAKKKVAEFQKQCEEYLVVIVQQKREADEQQKVCVLVCLMLRLFIRTERYDRTLILWYELLQLTMITLYIVIYNFLWKINLNLKMF